MKMNALEREQHIQRWKTSGVSKVAYAEQNGLNIQTFYSWFKLKSKKQPSGFVEIGRQQNIGDPQPSSSSIRIDHPRGYQLLIETGFDRKTLADVLDVLEAR